jgi:hypothetical protein
VTTMGLLCWSLVQIAKRPESLSYLLRAASGMEEALRAADCDGWGSKVSLCCRLDRGSI